MRGKYESAAVAKAADQDAVRQVPSAATAIHEGCAPNREGEYFMGAVTVRRFDTRVERAREIRRQFQMVADFDGMLCVAIDLMEEHR
jgi:hypothetical protein